MFTDQGKIHTSTRRKNHLGIGRNVRTMRSGTNDTKFPKLGQTMDTTKAGFTIMSGMFRPNVMLSKANYTSIHESSHLNGHSNYGAWAY